jgi:hypothetical protein
MRKTGPNSVRLDGDTAFLELTNIRGEVVAEAMIDAVDAPRVLGVGRRWTATWEARSASSPA